MTSTSTTTLIMGSGIQFLDFSLYIPKDPIKPAHALFLSEGGMPLWLTYDQDKKQYIDPVNHNNRLDKGKMVNSPLIKESLEILKEQWLPLPFFGKTGDSGQPFYFGPLNWARVFFAQLPDTENDRHQYHVVLVFDTKTWPEQKNLEEQDSPEFPYLRPYYEDVENGRQFALAHQIQDVKNFLSLDWVDGWLRAAVAGQEKTRLHLKRPCRTNCII